MDPKSLLECDLDRLQQAIDQLRAGYVGTSAAKIRYFAALVSRGVEQCDLERRTSCTWDLTENQKERAVRDGSER